MFCSYVNAKQSALCEVGDDNQSTAVKPVKSCDQLLPVVHFLENEGETKSVTPAGHEPSHHWLRDRDNNVLIITLRQYLE